MANGIGCKCHARYEGECCCIGVDWTPTVFFDDESTRLLERRLRGKKLRDQVGCLWNELRAAKKALQQLNNDDADLRDIVADVLQSGNTADMDELRRVYERQRNAT